MSMAAINQIMVLLGGAFEALPQSTRRPTDRPVERPSTGTTQIEQRTNLAYNWTSGFL